MNSGLILEDISDYISIFTLCKLRSIAKLKQFNYISRKKLNNGTRANLCEALI